MTPIAFVAETKKKVCRIMRFVAAALFLPLGSASAGHFHRGVTNSLSYRKKARALGESPDEEAVAVDNLHKAKKKLASAKATLDAAKAEVYAEGGEIDEDGNVVVKEEGNEETVSLRGSLPKTAGASPTPEVAGDAARTRTKDESYGEELGGEGQKLTREFDDINKAIDEMDQDIHNGDYAAAKQNEEILKGLGTVAEETEKNVTLIEEEKLEKLDSNLSSHEEGLFDERVKADESAIQQEGELLTQDISEMDQSFGALEKAEASGNDTKVKQLEGDIANEEGKVVVLETDIASKEVEETELEQQEAAELDEEDDFSGSKDDEKSVSEEEDDKIKAKMREEDNLITDQEIVLDAEVHESGNRIKALRDADRAGNYTKAQEIKSKMAQEETQELGVKAKIESEQADELKLANDKTKVGLLEAKKYADDEEIDDQEIVLTAEMKKTEEVMKTLQQAKKAGEKARAKELEDEVAMEESQELVVESKIESEEADELELEEEEEELENGNYPSGDEEDTSERV